MPPIIPKRKERFLPMQNMQSQAQPRWNTCCSDGDFAPKLGYGYVKMQKGIGKVYSPEKALMVGTIFPELNITMSEYERGLYNGK